MPDLCISSCVQVPSVSTFLIHLWIQKCQCTWQLLCEICPSGIRLVMQEPEGQWASDSDVTSHCSVHCFCWSETGLVVQDSEHQRGNRDRGSKDNSCVEFVYQRHVQWCRLLCCCARPSGVLAALCLSASFLPNMTTTGQWCQERSLRAPWTLLQGLLMLKQETQVCLSMIEQRVGASALLGVCDCTCCAVCPTHGFELLVAHVTP